MHPHLHFLRAASPLLVLLFLTLADLQGEIAGSTPSVPRPRGGTIEVERGGEVRIPLGIYGLASEQTTFVIRQEPERGSLGEIEIHDRATSVVTYTHNGVPGERSDAFTFAAKNSAGVSAPATLRVRITDRPALLIVPPRVVYDATPLGSSRSERIEIENRGGGLANGVIAVEEPWRLESDPQYELGPGETAAFTAVFEPTRTGEQRAYLRYSSHPTHQTELRGRGLPPFSVTPKELPLDSSTRAGELVLQNHTAGDLTLSVAGDARLVVTETMELPAEAAVTFSVAVAEDAPEGFKEELVFEGSSHREKVLVTAPPGPALLRADLEHLGEIDPEEPRAFTISNVGGSPTKVVVRAPAGVTIQPHAFGLAPGRQEALTLSSSGAAISSGKIVLEYGSRTLEIPFEIKSLLATATQTTPAPLPVFTPRAVTLEATAPRATLATREPSSEAYLEMVDPVESRVATLGEIGPIKVTEVTRNSASLKWPAEPGMIYHVEERHLEVRDGKLHVRWQASPEDKSRSEGGQGLIHFTGLAPGFPYTVRLYGEDTRGAFTPPSPPVTFKTVLAPRLRPSFRTLAIAGLVAVLGVFAYRKWREKRLVA